MKRETSVRNIGSTTNLIQENQAIKRQKLDDGKSRQILNPKPTSLLHKTRQALVNTGFNVCPSVTKHTPKENRKDGAVFLVQNQPKLTLTRPKEPEFVTSQRARPLRVKSSAELEEEMLAKIPKFKARPVNKKIMAAPALPAPQRSTPHLPEFGHLIQQTQCILNHWDPMLARYQLTKVWKPSSEIQTIDDALGSLVAWPSDKLLYM